MLSLPKKYQWVKWEGRLPDMLATKVELAFEGNRPVVEIKRTSNAEKKILFRIVQIDSFGTVRLITGTEFYSMYSIKESPKKRRRILEIIDDVKIVHEELCGLMALSKAQLYKGRKEVVA